MPRTRTVREVTTRRRGERCGASAARPAVRISDAARLTADLAVLAHPVRLQLLDVLLRNEGRICVCDLEAAVPVKQPTVSHHLKLLKRAGLVTGEKSGLWVHYRVRREALGALRERIAAGLAALG